MCKCIVDEKKIVLVLLNWSFNRTEMFGSHTWRGEGGALFQLGEATTIWGSLLSNWIFYSYSDYVSVHLLPCGAYEMYVIILPVSSQTLPCQLTGGTSCPTMICPNTAVNYTCNVGSYAGNTNWNVPSVGVCSGTTLSLVQAPLAQGQSCLSGLSSSGTCGPFTVTNTPPLTSNVYCLTSTLSVVVTSAMNGLVVSCSSYSPIYRSSQLLLEMQPYQWLVSHGCIQDLREGVTLLYMWLYYTIA